MKIIPYLQPLLDDRNKNFKKNNKKTFKKHMA